MHDKVEEALQIIAKAMDNYAELASSFSIVRGRVRELEKKVGHYATSELTDKISDTSELTDKISATSELTDKIVGLERQRHWLADAWDLQKAVPLRF